MTRARKLTPEQVWIAKLFRAGCADQAVCSRLEDPFASHRAAGFRRDSSGTPDGSATRKTRKLLDSLEGNVEERHVLQSSVRRR